MKWEKNRLKMPEDDILRYCLCSRDVQNMPFIHPAVSMDFHLDQISEREL